MQTLQRRCAGAKPLGLVKCDDAQLIVVFNGTFASPSFPIHTLTVLADVGCYINKDGTPARSSGYLRWETRADSYAHIGGHLILVSTSFVEIRTLQTGKLVQVIEGADMRLVHASERSVMIAVSEKGGGCKLVELVETADLAEQRMQVRSSGVSGAHGIWDEWDM